MSKVIARFRVDTRYTPGFMKPAMSMRAKPGARVIHVRGAMRTAVQQALAMSRTQHRSWAVTQAGDGNFDLVPMWINHTSDDPSIEALKELAEVPGHQKLWLERSDPSLVAVTDETAYVFGNASRLLVARD